MLKKMRLHYKIMILTVTVVFLVLILAGVLVIRDLDHQVEAHVSARAMDIGRIVAQTPFVQKELQSEHPNLQSFAERWRVASGAAFIVIANMEQIRLSHPLADNVGRPISDLYREPVLQGQEYVYIGKGSLAPSLRANVPIYQADSNRQIGFVSVGFYLTEIHELASAGTRQVLYALLIALAFSVGGAVFLARNVRKSIFGLEPYEIALLFKEREATLEAIREGLVAVDRNGMIRVINKEAAVILGIRCEDAYGQNINNILPDSSLETVIRTGQAIYDEEQQANELTIMASSVPILSGTEVVGAVVTFRDRTEVCRLAEELTGVHRLVDVLRAQAHEFKNKLHVVSGLIQLDLPAEAVDYITGTMAENQGSLEQLRYTVKDPVTFALLLGKGSRARELGIEFTFLPKTGLSSLPGKFTSGDMVLVLGNLLENAMEAVVGEIVPQVAVGIEEGEIGVWIRVQNSGPWIEEGVAATMFQRGMTTKQGSRGYGLALVGDTVAASGGSIAYKNLPSGGVEFVVFIPTAASE